MNFENITDFNPHTNLYPASTTDKATSTKWSFPLYIRSRISHHYGLETKTTHPCFSTPPSNTYTPVPIHKPIKLTEDLKNAINNIIEAITHFTASIPYNTKTVLLKKRNSRRNPRFLTPPTELPWPIHANNLSIQLFFQPNSSPGNFRTTGPLLRLQWFNLIQNIMLVLLALLSGNLQKKISIYSFYYSTQYFPNQVYRYNFNKSYKISFPYSLPIICTKYSYQYILPKISTILPLS